MIVGNDFIELLYLPLEDTKVKDMMNTLRVNKPIIDKDFKEDGYFSIISEIYGIEIYFSGSKKINFPTEFITNNNVFFSKIDFSSKSKISLPLQIHINMNYEELNTLLGVPNYESTRLPIKVWLKQREDKSFFVLSISFNKDEKISNVSLSTDTRKHLEKSRYFKKNDVDKP